MQDKFEIYQDDVEEHFEEEERDVAPVMRKIFVYKDYKQVCVHAAAALRLAAQMRSCCWSATMSTRTD